MRLALVLVVSTILALAIMETRVSEPPRMLPVKRCEAQWARALRRAHGNARVAARQVPRACASIGG